MRFQKKIAVSFSAELLFAVVFVGYSISYLTRFNPIGPIFLPIGFSHLAISAGALVGTIAVILYFRRLSKLEFVFLAWLSFAFLYALFAIQFGRPSHSILTQTLGLMQALSLWLIFRIVDLNGKRVKFSSLMALLVCGLAVIFVPTNITIDNAQLLSYHTTALILFICGFISISHTTKSRGFVLVFVTLSLLYINGARTEFYLMSAIAPFLVLRKLGLKAFVIGGMIVIVGILITLLRLSDLLETKGGSRIIGLLDPSRDQSYYERLNILNNAIATIYNNPILGEYASYDKGYYSHNFLSVWVDFGLFGLIFYLYLLVLIVRESVILFISNTRENLPILMLSATLILSVISSKAYFHPFVGVVVGIVARSAFKRNKRGLE